MSELEGDQHRPTRGRHLTVRQVADLLHVQPRTVRDWVHRGDLPGTRRARDGFLIPIEAVDAILEPADG